VTAANTTAEIEQLIDVLERLGSAFDLQPARTREAAPAASAEEAA
jgi:hypothetical protein